MLLKKIQADILIKSMITAQTKAAKNLDFKRLFKANSNRQVILIALNARFDLESIELLNKFKRKIFLKEF